MTKLSPKVNVTVGPDGICKGTLTIHHGRIKVGEDVLGTDIKWTCDVNGTHIDELLYDAIAQLSVEMAKVRDRENARAVIEELDGSTVHYSAIGSWTKKPRATRSMAKMNSAELAELIKQAQALLNAKSA
jgi:hypothetical protein